MGRAGNLPHQGGQGTTVVDLSVVDDDVVDLLEVNHLFEIGNELIIIRRPDRIQLTQSFRPSPGRNYKMNLCGVENSLTMEQVPTPNPLCQPK